MLGLTGHVDVHNSYTEYEQIVLLVLSVGHLVLAQGKLVVAGHMREVGEHTHLVHIHGLLTVLHCVVSNKER